MHTIAPIKKRIFSQLKILVVESDRNDLAYVSSALKPSNCNCLVASEAMHGLSLAQQEQPDLILLDLQMPHGGIELLTTLKLDWLTRDIPVIALTTLEKSQKIILDAKFDGYLLKPYLLDDMLYAIATYLPNVSL